MGTKISVVISLQKRIGIGGEITGLFEKSSSQNIMRYKKIKKSGKNQLIQNYLKIYGHGFKYIQNGEKTNKKPEFPRKFQKCTRHSPLVTFTDPKRVPKAEENEHVYVTTLQLHF